MYCEQDKEGKELKYRDRAAERRHLHGANSIAPCQKDADNGMGWACDDDPAIAQEEARLLSFGTDSYGSKIMQSMGWKQVTVLNLWLDFITTRDRITQLIWICLMCKTKGGGAGEQPEGHAGAAGSKRQCRNCRLGMAMQISF